MIIDRYLVREVIRPFLLVSILLLGIFTTFSLARFLVDANAGLLKVSEVVQLTALKALIALEVLIPLSFYLAVMIGLGRLYADSEIYSMRASGISEHRILRPILNLAFVLALLIGGFSIMVRPWAYVQVYEVKAQARASSEVDRIKPSRFHVFDDEDRTVYVEHISDDGKDLQGVFIRSRPDDNLQVITSAGGEFDYRARPSFHRIRLSNARVFKRVEDGPDFFARLGTFTLWMPAERPAQLDYEPESVNTNTLRHSSSPDDRAEFQWRLSTPISTLLLALLAIPLSRSRPREGRYARMLLSLVVYAIYFSLLDISRSWVQQDSVRYIWWVTGLLGLAVLALYLPWKKISKSGDRRRA
jgi:lipopolysaccharide export system permease protein